MDIGSGNKWPANALSNFAPHHFVIDGVECHSMEGFLQSLKFKEPDLQATVCLLVGRSAKFRGKKKAWWATQTLWWKGEPMARQGEEFQQLLNRAFEAMTEQSALFRKALLASGNATLKHRIGKTDPTHTVLTVNEFCSRLTSLRDRLNRGELGGLNE